ncbi:FAD-binding protein, partial [Bradyrhizobium neotropicale]|uniref:FAD-binding protein n=1 Tax=Bradyrhizobium neotropicale TaxID=1497615 RepID=UPI001FDA241C
MTGSAVVSNHEGPAGPSSFETLAPQAPQDEVGTGRQPQRSEAPSSCVELISAANFATRFSVDTLKVRDAKDVEEVVRAAIANEQPLEIIGHGTKRGIGHAMATNAVLDVSALSAVTSYEPNELIVTLQAGAPLADVLSLIDSKNQQFAFEPMNT